MLTIRLQRTGRKNNPSFRLIIIDSKRGPKSGNVLEVLGSYDPKAGKREFKGERITHWLSHGAKTSGTVHNMLIDAKLVTGKKLNVLPKKKPILKEAKEGAPEASASAPASAEKPAESAPETPVETPAEVSVEQASETVTQ